MSKKETVDEVIEILSRMILNQINSKKIEDNEI